MNQILTDAEIKAIPAMMATDTALNYARAIEQAVMVKREAELYIQFKQAYEQGLRESRELYEAKLREQKPPIAWMMCGDTEGSDMSDEAFSWDKDTSTGHVIPVFRHSAPSAPEWISVEDRLPKQEPPVLVSRKGRSQPQITCYYGKDWVLESNHYPVTHWMPLPPMAAARSE